MPDAPELLLLVPTRSYRTDDFVAAARRLGVGVVLGSDLCHEVEERTGGVEGLVCLPLIGAPSWRAAAR